VLGVKGRVLDNVGDDGIEFGGGRLNTTRLLVEWAFAVDVDKRQSAFTE
jgi:hypothetical protein